MGIILHDENHDEESLSISCPVQHAFQVGTATLSYELPPQTKIILIENIFDLQLNMKILFDYPYPAHNSFRSSESVPYDTRGIAQMGFLS